MDVGAGGHVVTVGQGGLVGQVTGGQVGQVTSGQGAVVGHVITGQVGGGCVVGQVGGGCVVGGGGHVVVGFNVTERNRISTDEHTVSYSCIPIVMKILSRATPAPGISHL